MLGTSEANNVEAGQKCACAPEVHVNIESVLVPIARGIRTEGLLGPPLPNALNIMLNA